MDSFRTPHMSINFPLYREYHNHMGSEEHKSQGSSIRLDRITTRTGDRGMSTLPGRATAKYSPELSAIGELDELGAFIGWAIAAQVSNNIERSLRRVQSHLFEIGGLIASGKGELGFEDEIGWLERWHNELNSELDPLKSFILAGGTEQAARIQVTRAVCRRAERCYWKLQEAAPAADDVKPFFVQAGVYLNRLSDLLFTLARHLNAKDGMQEPEWVPRK